MDIDLFYKSYWKYYLGLENSLLELERYINFEEKNWKVYSNEFIKLLEVIGAEVDIIAKEIVLFKYPHLKNVDGISKWGYYIQQLIPDISSEKLRFLHENVIIPWNNWEYEKYISKKGQENYRLKKNKNTPEWWISYNKVKHSRTSTRNGGYNYERANLGNVINAIGALYLLEIYFINELTKDNCIVLEEQSRLFC